MLEALSGDVGVQLVAGATGLASLGALVWAAGTAAPRPCWTKRRGCLLKAENGDACAGCSVFLRSRVPEYQIRGLPDLGEIQRLRVIGAAE
jgi:hypothetical protein